MSITIPINECTSFSVKKSAKDPPPLLLASKKKKYVVLGAFVSAGVGLVALSAAQYSPSSGGGGDGGDGGGGDGGGGGIRASIIIDGSLSSVDLSSCYGEDCTCSPQSGTWGGKSFNGDGPTSFETCYKYGPTGEECWSKSFFDDEGNTWFECQPQGYTGDDQGWKFLNSGAATSTCGSPCEIFDYFQIDDVPVV